MDAGMTIVVLLFFHYLAVPVLLGVVYFYFRKSKKLSKTAAIAVSSLLSLATAVLFTEFLHSIHYGGSRGAILLYLCVLVWFLLGAAGAWACIVLLVRGFREWK